MALRYYIERCKYFEIMFCHITKEYFKSDDEVHAIINFANKTTTRINSGGDRLLVTVLTM